MGSDFSRRADKLSQARLCCEDAPVTAGDIYVCVTQQGAPTPLGPGTILGINSHHCAQPPCPECPCCCQNSDKSNKSGGKGAGWLNLQEKPASAAASLRQHRLGKAWLGKGGGEAHPSLAQEEAQESKRQLRTLEPQLCLLSKDNGTLSKLFGPQCIWKFPHFRI